MLNAPWSDKLFETVLKIKVKMVHLSDKCVDLKNESICLPNKT